MSNKSGELRQQSSESSSGDDDVPEQPDCADQASKSSESQTDSKPQAGIASGLGSDQVAQPEVSAD